MAFEVHDYRDLVRLLGDHPEWRAELRRLLLTDELLELPAIVRELAEAQRRTEERLARVEEQIAALAEAQRRTEERLGRVEEQIAALAEAQRRTEERLARVEEQIAALAEAQRRTEEKVAALAEAQRVMLESLQRLEQRVDRLESRFDHLETRFDRLEGKVGNLEGRELERMYRERVHAYFGRMLRRPRVVELSSLLDTLERHLSEDEVYDVLLLDLLVCGPPRHQPEAPDVWLAIEVSATVDINDVERARRRAELLRKAGYRAIPVVAGETTTEGAEDEARREMIAWLQDGRVFFWDEAMQAWTTP